MESTHPVVFIDGECALCNRFATWLVRHDPGRVHRLATLQGRTARELVGLLDPDPSTWAIVLVDADGVHSRSEAVLRIAAGLGGPWRIGARIGRWIPGAARDRLYGLVARRRYRWFGKEKRCRRPRPGEEGFFLP